MNSTAVLLQLFQQSQSQTTFEVITRTMCNDLELQQYLGVSIFFTFISNIHAVKDKLGMTFRRKGETNSNDKFSFKFCSHTQPLHVISV